jgi:ATP-dependent exoDNAse (exonuclease V) beta subunit
MARPYIRSLEVRDIPHLLVASRSFHQREEVETLRAASAAIEWPDDELAVYAALRGPLFSIPDNLLFRYRFELKLHLHPLRVGGDGCR